VTTLKKLVQGIGCMSEWIGKTICFLNLALVLTITIDVFLRYVFNAPTKWSYDITYMLGGTLILMSISYVTLHRGHVSIDIVRRRIPTRMGLSIDLLLHVLLFFPLILVLLYTGTDHALTSIAQREVSDIGFWRPPLYPFRTMIPLAFLLVFLQGVANFVQDALALAGRSEDL